MIWLAVSYYDEPLDMIGAAVQSAAGFADRAVLVWGKHPGYRTATQPHWREELCSTSGIDVTWVRRHATEVVKRNLAYSIVQADPAAEWVLWLDADEVLQRHKPVTLDQQADAVEVSFTTQPGPGTTTNQWERAGQTVARRRIFRTGGLGCGPEHYTHYRGDIDLIGNNATGKHGRQPAVVQDATDALTIHHHTLHRPADQVAAKRAYIDHRNQTGAERG